MRDNPGEIVRCDHICQLMDEFHPEGSPHNKLVSHVKDRAGHDRRYAIDAKKITTELGYHPAETFHTGIRKTIEWYIANKQWFRNVIDGSYQGWINKNYG